MLLLVEDNFDDVFFLRRAMEKANISVPLFVTENGQQAIDYLKGTGEYNDRVLHPLPSIVLLDLKLPYVNGFEILKWIRDQPALANLRVVILTSSPEPRDRKMAAELGATAYVVKPPTSEVLIQLLAQLHAEHA